MNAWISVLTCAARGDYLEGTIASLERGGAGAFGGRKIIHVDGPVTPALEQLGARFGWELESVSPVPRGGARHAMVAIMRRAAAAGVEQLLYFEDDVLVCKNAIRAMLEIGVPEPLGFVSYCDLRWDGAPLELVAFPGCPRAYPVADGGFVGCQALSIPARTLQAFTTWQPPPWLDHNNCDLAMGTIASSYGILDSLADHVGKMSAIMQTEYSRLRAVRGWRGEDFDADVVPRMFTLNDLGERCPLHVGVLHRDRLKCAGSTEMHGLPGM